MIRAIRNLRPTVVDSSGASEFADAALVALDWGTSSLRAFLMSDKGDVVDARHASTGIQHLPVPAESGGFEQAVAQIARDWLARWPGLPVVAGGMVGSAQGWKETPYVRCPADARALAAQGVRVQSGLGPEVLIAPGVLFDVPDRSPDVMRGEEIQIAGALAAHPAWAERACIVLPGTHSKWARIEDGRIVSFATYMTGELYAVLRRHSILGRLMPEGAPAEASVAEAAFARGLEAARASMPGDLTHQLFATRTLGLTQRLPTDVLGDYLSGLLIGHELVSGLGTSRALLDSGAPLLLIGDVALCRRYGQALERLGAPDHTRLDNTAPRGLWEFARTAGLVH